MDDADAVAAATAPPDSAGHHDGHVLRLPSVGVFARHALPPIVEGAIGPAAIFYVVLTLSGFRGALIAAIVWSCLATVRRLAKRERVPGLLLLGLVLLAARTFIAYATGSAFVYFLQPAVGTFLVGLLFAASAIAKRPVIERLALEFCPLDLELMSRPFVKTFFLRLSMLWCAVLTVNAGLVVGLLFESSLRTFVVERTVVSSGLTITGILLSTMWFIRVMNRAGITVRFGNDHAL